MSTAPFSLSLSQNSLVKPFATVLLIIFTALIIISVTYFVLSQLAKADEERSELISVKQDKEATTRTFSIIAGLSLVGLLCLIIGEVVLRGGSGDGDGEEGEVRGYERKKESKEQTSTTPSGFIAEQGKKYSGKELVKLYENLPHNAIIHCDLEVTSQFEECTVLRKDLFWITQEYLLNILIKLWIGKALNVVQRFKDPTTNTTIITTRKNVVGFVGYSVSEYPESKFLESLLETKIARNKIYQLVYSSVGDCKVLDFGSKEKNYTNIKYWYSDTSNNNQYVKEGERKIQCPDLSNASTDPANLAKLYKAILNYPVFKLAFVSTESGKPLIEKPVNTRDPKERELVILRDHLAALSEHFKLQEAKLDGTA